MKRYFKGVDGLEPGKYFNYSAMTTNVIMNYVIYKTGDDWNKLLHKIFVEDAKVAKRVYFHKTLNKNNSWLALNALIIGAGGVTSSIIWAIRELNLKGKLYITNKL